MNKILSLDEARGSSTGHLRTLVANGLAEIRMVVSADVARRLALDTERINSRVRDMSVSIVLLLKRLDAKEVHFTQEELLEALPKAVHLGSTFDKDGGLKVHFPGLEAKAEVTDDPEPAAAAGDGDAPLDQSGALAGHDSGL